MSQKSNASKRSLLVLCLLSVMQVIGCKKHEAPKSFSHEDTNKFSASSIRIDDSSKTPIDNAITVLNNEPKTWEDYDARVDAVNLLGNLHATKAIPLLIEGLMKFTPIMSDNIGDLNVPASEALVKIGKPAVSPILQRFETTSNRLERLILLNTLVKIEGKPWTLDYLQHLKPGNADLEPQRKFPALENWVRSL